MTWRRMPEGHREPIATNAPTATTLAARGARRLRGDPIRAYGRDHANPPVTQAAPWPDARAEDIFEASCAACHSNETEWPWYSHVAPASWLVYRDVVEGRDEMNVSRWEDDAGEADDEAQILIDALRRMDD